MDLLLLERFLVSMMPPIPTASETVHAAFAGMKSPPAQAVNVVNAMLGSFQYKLYSSNDQEAASAAALVLTGVMLAWATENKILREYVIENYLDQAEKIRGKNVVSFHDKKAGK